LFANGQGKGGFAIASVFSRSNLLRFSQKWTREGNLNPSEIVLELEDFIEREMASHLTSIFGVHRYDQLVAAAKLEVAKKCKD